MSNIEALRQIKQHAEFDDGQNDPSVLRGQLLSILDVVNSALATSKPEPSGEPNKATWNAAQDLLGRYWQLAFREGSEGVNLAEEANQVLSEFRALLAADKAAGEEWPDKPISQDEFSQWFDSLPWYVRSMVKFTNPQPHPAAQRVEAEFEVWQNDEMVCSASGPRDMALRETRHYLAQYEQDGPVEVFEVRRIAIDAAMLKEGK